MAFAPVEVVRRADIDRLTVKYFVPTAGPLKTLRLVLFFGTGVDTNYENKNIDTVRCCNSGLTFCGAHLGRAARAGP